MTKYDYDVIVIGGGSGGITSSFTTAGLGKKTALIEKRKIGGECTWFGCVPSKALIRVGEAAQEIKDLSKYGLKLKSSPELDVSGALDYIHKVQEQVYAHETPEVFEKRGIKVLFGSPVFKDAHSIEMEGKTLTADKFVLSTGTSPFVPPIEGIQDVDYLTNETVFDQKKVPVSMIVLGGGPIGVEMAQAWSRLGVKVTVVEMMDSILFREDSEMVEILAHKMEQEGLTLLTGTKAVKVSQSGKQITLLVEKAGNKQDLTAETLLVAVGRKPNLDGLGLERAGVEYHTRGVKVNNLMQTSAKNIYAVGDIAGPYQFSHVAEYQGVAAGVNIALPFKRKVNYDGVLWATFTQPELGRIGITEAEARKKYGKRVGVYKISYGEIDRPRTESTTEGLAKYILDPKGYLVGAHIVGAHAGEMIHEAQILKTLHIKFSTIQTVMHAYPTYSDIIRQAGKRAYVAELNNKWYIKLIKLLAGKK